MNNLLDIYTDYGLGHHFATDKGRHIGLPLHSGEIM